MKCLHCGANCTEYGTDMSLEVFELSCKMAKKYHDDICIGGGEPTLHPQFESFLGIALNYSYSVGLVTNGTNTELCNFLFEMMEERILWCDLSVDIYHDLTMVDKGLIRKFYDHYRKTGSGIRNVSLGDAVLANTGRAKISKQKGLIQQGVDENCFCPELYVLPDGKIFHCECKKVAYGTVFDPTVPEKYHRVKHTCSVNDHGWEKYLTL